MQFDEKRESSQEYGDSLSTLEVNVQGCEWFQSNKKVHNASCVAIVRAIVKLAQSTCGILKLLISVCVCVGGGGQMRLIHDTGRQTNFPTLRQHSPPKRGSGFQQVWRGLGTP